MKEILEENNGCSIYPATQLWQEQEKKKKSTYLRFITSIIIPAGRPRTHTGGARVGEHITQPAHVYKRGGSQAVVRAPGIS